MTYQGAKVSQKFAGFSTPQQNYSKLPHEFIDLLPEISSVSELKVMLYILRHTWGFSEYGKPKKISINEFTHGRRRSNRTRMDNGTGLSENSVRAGLEAAVEHGFISVEVDNSDGGRIEKWYQLVMNSIGEEIEDTPSKLEPHSSNFEPRTEKETIRKKKSLAAEDAAVRIRPINKDLLPYLIEFSIVTGIDAINPALSSGAKKTNALAAQEWQKEGIELKYISEAYEKFDTDDKRHMITTLRSLIKTARALKAINSRQDNDVKVRKNKTAGDSSHFADLE